jgi:predicted RNA-binding Zn-ribbon protein involved in translation (DUF1610 family)/uncharacterized protein with HEPN domain
MDYNVELEKIDTLLTKKQYKTIVRDVGWLFEMALKDLYKQQIDFFERNKDNAILAKEYRHLLVIQEETFSGFDIEKETFARISHLFFKTNFNQLIELRINTPLTFTRTIPWRDIREMRNRILHTKNVTVDRKLALKFIDYLQTYLKETKLTESVTPVGETKCYSCHELIDRSWKFCPNCGVELSLRCKKCGHELKPEWIVCPHCNTPRDGVKVGHPGNIYGYYCQAVWSDGFLNRDENHFLQRKQKELGLDDAEAKKIERKHAPENAVRFRDMVESCLTDGHIDESEKNHLRDKANSIALDHDLANSIYLASVNDKIGVPLFGG